ncbi:MAG: hypothetical protein JZU65_12495 [Chlorobium sp.]|jgi:hypothetical protein|nr:hypothetical protein [Chlorobium sp.]
MKTNKKVLGQDLEAIISGSKTGGGAVVKSNVGRPKNKVTKKLCSLYLPENIVEAIDLNCRGNKSFFAEEVFRYYFDAHKIDIDSNPVD